MSFVLGRSERQGISTPFQFGQHRENNLTSSRSSHINDDGQDSVEYLNASQMSQSQPARDVPLIKNANGVAARVAKTVRIETQSDCFPGQKNLKEEVSPIWNRLWKCAGLKRTSQTERKQGVSDDSFGDIALAPHMLAWFKDWNPRFPPHAARSAVTTVTLSTTLPQTTFATGLSVITKEEIGNSLQRSMPQASLSRKRVILVIISDIKGYLTNALPEGDGLTLVREYEDIFNKAKDWGVLRVQTIPFDIGTFPISSRMVCLYMLMGQSKTLSQSSNENRIAYGGFKFISHVNFVDAYSGPFKRSTVEDGSPGNLPSTTNLRGVP
ncbi:hypothetical protein BGY98DRAFT_1173103 [Russula aff. rugulosa BPL654]|nr:hypothetical protein BGY98DRAFT_1173103 [Russula aff. rugulosa BPL654]